MAALPRALAPLRHAYRLLAASLALSLLAAGAVGGRRRLAGRRSRRRSGGAVAGHGRGGGGMLASTLLGGALADRIPQRHILLAAALIQAARSP